MAGIVFDFYGTLANYQPGFDDAPSLLRRFGYTCPDEIQLLYGANAFDGTLHPAGRDYYHWRLEHYAQICTWSGVESDRVYEMARLLFHAEISRPLRLIEGAQEALTVARSLGLAVGICSNWDMPLNFTVRQLGLGPIDAMLTSAQRGARKPHKSIFSDTIKSLGCHAQGCLMVGDRFQTDILGALRSRMNAVWISADGDHELARNLGVTLLPDLPALAEILPRLRTTL